MAAAWKTARVSASTCCAPSRFKGVVFRFATDVFAKPELLAPFDRIVVATGAEYRFGPKIFANLMLDTGMARAPGLARLFASSPMREWFYYNARRGTAARYVHLARPEQQVIVIGDAARADKSKQAIASAFDAALRGGQSMR